MSKKNNHAFIVGLPRSGTSIKYRTIQKLPGFQSEKLNFWETKLFRDEIGFNADDLYYPSLVGFLGGQKEVYGQFLSGIKKYTDQLKRRAKTPKYTINIKPQQDLTSKGKVFLRNKLAQFNWNRSPKNKIIKEYFKYAREYRQTTRIIEKTPHHYLNVHQILWTFPNSRIIWMIRHPIDIITSSIKRAKKDERYKNYWETDNFIQEFRTCFYRYEFLAKEFKKNILLVKYEDFVNAPEDELKRICGFLGEPYDSESLTITKKETPKWKSESHLFSGIVTNTGRNWQDHLSLEDAKKIETALENVMEKYQFDFYARG